ncbi:MAG: hypothetical protein IT266_02555 [Saprospiraceae bacterium]|nr:hypothetical protein [Saprospiraceae bacterium]
MWPGNHGQWADAADPVASALASVLRSQACIWILIRDPFNGMFPAGVNSMLPEGVGTYDERAFVHRVGKGMQIGFGAEETVSCWGQALR